MIGEQDEPCQHRAANHFGLKWLRTEDSLPQQHVMTFEKPAAD